MFQWFKARSKISSEEAREIAEQVCKEKGWYFAEPVSVTSSLFQWKILTNASKRGANAEIVVDRATHKVKRSNFLPR